MLERRYQRGDTIEATYAKTRSRFSPRSSGSSIFLQDHPTRGQHLFGSIRGLYAAPVLGNQHTATAVAPDGDNTLPLVVVVGIVVARVVVSDHGKH